MAIVPIEIEKISVEIKNCMNIYEILNFFNYQFRDDDDYNKKWNVFAAPKSTMEKIDKQ